MGCYAAHAQHFREIADEAVGDVHAAVGVSRHRRRQRHARHGQEITLQQMAPMRLREFGPLPQPQPQPERGVADRARDVETVARPDAGARRHAARFDRAERRDCQSAAPAY